MAKANYTYEVIDFAGRNCIVIEDLNDDQIPVTSDINNVIQDIEQDEGLAAKDYLVVYKDTDGMWDGWDDAKKMFVGLQLPDRDMAIHKYIQLQLNAK